MDYLKEALAIKEQLINWRRDFHRNPELGFEVYRTSSVIKEFLKNQSIDYKEVAGTGICATINGDISRSNSKTVALRADMDALPLIDKKGCEYSSIVQGKMHACGHDAHMAILMGVAKILNEKKKSINGTVKLFFEPAEETVGGSRFMIKEGILENPFVNGVFGLHVAENIEAGFIGVKRGVVNAASNPFTIKIKGKGGHGAHPDTTIDPIVISSSVILALQSIVSREIPPTDAAVITIGSIHGGTVQNIIPEEVVIGGIIRTMKKEQREYVKNRLVEVTEGIVKAMRGTVEINIEESYPCLYNNDEMLDIIIKSAESIIGKDKIKVLEDPNMGVESFAYFSMERPSAFYYLGSGNKEKGIINPAHGNYFDIEEKCLPIGVAIQCEAVARFLL